MKNIWIDTDPGLDDAIALIWAIQQEKILNWKIKGISTVKGNLGLDQINGNIVALLKHLGRTDIPLYSGASSALIQKPISASYIHGTALGPFDIAPIPHLSEKKAPEALANCLASLDGKIELITLGPLTNIAIFLRLYPELKEKIKHIYMMGGGTYGNVSHYAEFNIYVDPEAAKIVFDSGILITMSGLDISDECTYIMGSELEEFFTPHLNKWIKPILEFLKDIYKVENPKISLYDPTAMVSAAYPELFTTYNSPVTVELQGEARGMTLIPTKDTFEVSLPQNITTKVLKSCDRKQFLQILFQGL